MKQEEQNRILTQALRVLTEKCPRLRKMCYWAGTSAIALEVLHHRQSFDLDFHTYRALTDVRPVLAEIQKTFPGRFELLSAPDEFGSGFKGIFILSDKAKVTVEVLSNFQDVEQSELTDSKIAPGMKRITPRRYLADKIQCITEKSEARDLVDMNALLQKFPELASVAKEIIAGQDALILIERLLSWSDQTIQDDLLVYTDVDPRDAMEARDFLLEWLKKGKDR